MTELGLFRAQQIKAEDEQHVGDVRRRHVDGVNAHHERKLQHRLINNKNGACRTSMGLAARRPRCRRPSDMLYRFMARKLPGIGVMVPVACVITNASPAHSSSPHPVDSGDIDVAWNGH
ncbi:hypothetical protein RB195_013374 [Necator americanus]|uniref:Uncharacterized protein n=1 Tax=Necator americanus TaxID=51031 RepID=A0ABR1DWC7_NECAM